MGEDTPSRAIVSLNKDSFMSGFFGCVSRNECVNEVFYGTDYHSHLGTKRAGMAFVKNGKFIRSIHSLEDGYFRNKFESELPRFEEANMGVGVISDNESQPITITSHVGRYAVVTVARIDNYFIIFKRLFAFSFTQSLANHTA